MTAAVERTLETRAVTVRFGGVTAVDGVDIQAASKEIVGLVGPNGAGKTTLFNVLCGFVRPASGSVVLDGVDITRRRAHERAALGVNRTFQIVKVFPAMTCLENVLVGGHARTTSGIVGALVRSRHQRHEERDQRALAREFLDLVGLSDVADSSAEALPFGHRRRLEIARALMSRPSFLLMDEPASGANRQEQAELSRLIDNVRGQTGIGIVLVEHSIPFVTGLADRLVVLAHGRTIFQGAASDAIADVSVQDAYLGTRYG
jgi:branched-chain amino acid transport system ATP-binding protein